MDPKKRLLPLVCGAILAFTATCGPDPVPVCEDTCDLCCDQESDCMGNDRDQCYSECFANCERSMRIYDNATCFDANLALKQCTCALSCTELDEFENGTVDHCSAEVQDEIDACEWF